MIMLDEAAHLVAESCNLHRALTSVLFLIERKDRLIAVHRRCVPLPSA